MRKTTLATVLSLTFLFSACGAPVEEYEETVQGYAEPSGAPPTEEAEGEVVIRGEYYEVFAVRKDVQGVDCVIAQSAKGLTMECDFDATR